MHATDIVNTTLNARTCGSAYELRVLNYLQKKKDRYSLTGPVSDDMRSRSVASYDGYVRQDSNNGYLTVYNHARYRRVTGGCIAHARALTHGTRPEPNLDAD